MATAPGSRVLRLYLLAAFLALPASALGSSGSPSNLTSRVDRCFSGTYPGSVTVVFEYDGLSRLRAAIDDNGAPSALGVATSFTFDSAGRKLTERHQIGASVGAN